MEPAFDRSTMQQNERVFMRACVPDTSELTVELGPLGRRPTRGVPLNISRRGVQVRTDAPFPVTVGEELLIHFHDPAESVTPGKTLGHVRRVEESGDCTLVAVEFSESLADICF